MRSAETASRPGERLQPPLENDHLLVAVHPLDAEDRFRVKLADGAGDGLGCHPLMETLVLIFPDPGQGARANVPMDAGSERTRPTRQVASQGTRGSFRTTPIAYV